MFTKHGCVLPFKFSILISYNWLVWSSFSNSKSLFLSFCESTVVKSSEESKAFNYSLVQYSVVLGLHVERSARILYVKRHWALVKCNLVVQGSRNHLFIAVKLGYSIVVEKLGQILAWRYIYHMCLRKYMHFTMQSLCHLISNNDSYSKYLNDFWFWIKIIG